MKNYSLAISLSAAFLAVIALMISPFLSVVVIFVALVLWYAVDTLANLENEDVACGKDEKGTVFGRLDVSSVPADHKDVFVEA